MQIVSRTPLPAATCETLVDLQVKLKPCKETPGTPDPETCSAIWLHNPDERGEHFYSEGSRLKVELNLCHPRPPSQPTHPTHFDTIAYTLFPVLSLTKM